MTTNNSNASELFFSLSTMAIEVEKLLKLIPIDKLNWKPKSWDGNPGENFSAIEQICHLRDIEIDGYHYRIHTMLKEDNPILKSVEGYKLAIERIYENNNLPEVISEFKIAREKTLNLIAKIENIHLDNTAFFEGYGTITLKALIHFLCSHDFEHLASLRWLLGKIESDKLSE
jgi:hypothetical protein